MKILTLMTLLMSLNLNINLLMIFNYMYLNMYISPLKQLMYLITYMIFMTINILMSKQMISLNLFILMIIFISGMMILFSYFISLTNNLSMKSNHLKLIFMNMMILLISMIQMKQFKILLKNFYFNYNKTNKFNIIKKLYLKPNFYILLMFIIMLIFMLLMMVKICNIEYKNLRSKKWKN
uniref:NADH dehydrogenase subunit 6 n=1 Tax=Bombus sylvestris TaxID=30201 RepID=A0A0S2LTE2_BOMSL|nr:NADH dehydrogenase subunit 6 [Bombus sylvestris]